MFKEKSPDYTELSDRMLFNWMEKSGLKTEHLTCRDGFAEPALRALFTAFAPLSERHYVVMDICGNLLKERRDEILARFPKSKFTVVPIVIVGQPKQEFKVRAHADILKEKTAKAN